MEVTNDNFDSWLDGSRIERYDNHYEVINECYDTLIVSVEKPNWNSSIYKFEIEDTDLSNDNKEAIYDKVYEFILEEMDIEYNSTDEDDFGNEMYLTNDWNN